MHSWPTERLGFRWTVIDLADLPKRHPSDVSLCRTSIRAETEATGDARVTTMRRL